MRRDSTLPERSGKIDRMPRVNELVKRELAGLLERDPVPELSGVLVSVTEVRCSIDLRNAAVSVSVFGGGVPARETAMHHLNKMRPDWQHKLAKNLGFKHTPVLVFDLDDRQAAGDRVLELLREQEAHREPSGENRE